MRLNLHGIHSSVKAESAGVDETQQSTQGTKLETKDKADRYIYTMYERSRAWNANYSTTSIQASPSKYKYNIIMREIIDNPSTRL